ncbi:hypothetical protein AERO9A_320022 [Aeromonas salmonicida]|nr:hypothetical protein AERO9A_320022 [Aeromonas salmonicida]
MLAYCLGPIDGIGRQYFGEGSALMGAVILAIACRFGDPGCHVDEGARVPAVHRCIAACHQDGARLASILDRIERIVQVAEGVIQCLIQGLSCSGRLDEGGDQHVIGYLGRGPGVGEGEIQPQLPQPFLIVRVHHLQVGQGMGDPLVTIAGTGGLQGIQSDPGTAIADAVHMNAETRVIEGGDIVLEVGIPVIDDAIAASIFAVGGDGHLLGGKIHGQMGMLVVFQHTCIGQKGRCGEGISFQHTIEEDLDRIGLDQRIVGKGAPDLAGLGEVAGNIQLAAVVILVKTGGGSDAHVQQSTFLHVEQALADEIGGAGILDPGYATGSHQGRDRRQYLVILCCRLFIAGVEHSGFRHRNGAASPLPDHATGQVNVGLKMCKHAPRCQGHIVETHCIAILILRTGQRLRVVGTGMTIDPKEHHRIVWRRDIQRGQQGCMGRRRRIAVVGRPLIDHQPASLAGGITGQTCFYLVRQLIQRDALTIEIAHIQCHCAEQMDMVVVQTGQYHPAFQIHRLTADRLIGLGPLQRAHIEKLAIGNHHGLGDPALPILSVDLAVEIEGSLRCWVCALLVAAGQQSGHQQQRRVQCKTLLLAIHMRLLSLVRMQFLLQI